MIDAEMQEMFENAEKEMQAVAQKYGFEVRLIEDKNGTWLFYPTVKEDC